MRPFISRSARQAYLATFLLISTAILLFGAAVIAYALFYYSYIPRIGFERTVHLQFDHVYAPETIARHAHPYPYGSVTLGPDLIGQQAYDVKIELTMPRTPENIEAGNFMLEANMYAAGYDARTPGISGSISEALRADISAPSTTADTERKALLATSRRPAILPYRSRLVDLLYKATELHWYLLGLRSEAVTLTVPIYEQVAFGRGRANIPATLRLELQSASRLQVYSAKVHFRARFRGLRWLMYNHRIFAAILFIGLFWTTEMLFAGISWAVLAVHLAKQKGEERIKAEGRDQPSSSDRRIKSEEEDDEASDPARLTAALSDTERTFPTLSGQSPLRYTSASDSGVTIKREEDDGVPVAIPEALGSRATEADDEDEDEDMDFFDSGIGTSLESSGPARSDSMRRRRSRK